MPRPRASTIRPRPTTIATCRRDGPSAAVDEQVARAGAGPGRGGGRRAGRPRSGGWSPRPLARPPRSARSSRRRAGPWAPQRYGLPRWPRAKATARAARAPSPAAGARARKADGRQVGQPAGDQATKRAGVGRGQGGQDRHHHQHGHPAQLRTPPARVQVRGRLVAPAGRPRPHRARLLATSRRRPRRAGRRPRPWAASLVAGMLGLGLGGGRPPAAAPAAAAAARLVGVTTAAKVQHQERDRSRGAGAAAQRLGRPGGLRWWHAGSCGITTARARAAQGAVAALAGPVDRPQLLDRGRVLAAPAGGPAGRRPAGRTGSRTTAGPLGGGRTHRPA